MGRPGDFGFRATHPRPLDRWPNPILGGQYRIRSALGDGGEAMQQWPDAVVSQILERSRCNDIGCPCQANASKPAGVTHCPVCGQLKLRVGIEYGRRFLDPKCGCALETVKQGLSRKGVNLSAA